MTDWTEAEHRAREVLSPPREALDTVSALDAALARDFLALLKENERQKDFEKTSNGIVKIAQDRIDALESSLRKVVPDGCTFECATLNSFDADCDCGYIEARELLGEK
jgi:hypothetical protein